MQEIIRNATHHVPLHERVCCNHGEPDGAGAKLEEAINQHCHLRQRMAQRERRRKMDSRVCHAAIGCWLLAPGCWLLAARCPRPSRTIRSRSTLHHPPPRSAGWLLHRSNQSDSRKLTVHRSHSSSPSFVNRQLDRVRSADSDEVSALAHSELNHRKTMAQAMQQEVHSALRVCSHDVHDESGLMGAD